MRRLMVGMIAVGLLLSGRAFAFDLSGAWASERELCDHVFEKKGGAVIFAELSELYGSGFIARGNAIKGRNANCTIRSSKQDAEVTTLSASCATTIMTGDYQFSYKVLDDNTIVRSFSDIKDMTVKYSRCPQ